MNSKDFYRRSSNKKEKCTTPANSLYNIWQVVKQLFINLQIIVIIFSSLFYLTIINLILFFQ